MCASASRQQYHKRLLQLFEKCCRSKNTGAQAVLQKYIPAIELMEACVTSRLNAHSDDYAYRTILCKLANQPDKLTSLVAAGAVPPLVAKLHSSVSETSRLCVLSAQDSHRLAS